MIHIDAAEVAKLVRKTLKAEFPDTKFSVRTSKYSMGASITIRWQDGPTAKEVGERVNIYEGAEFDGMQDLKSYKSHTNDDGEEVHFGSDFIFCERSVSAAVVKPFADYIAQHYHCTSHRIDRQGDTMDMTRYKLEEHEYDGYTRAGFPWTMEENQGYVGDELFGDFVMKQVRTFGNFENYKQHLEDERMATEAWIAEKKETAEEDHTIDKLHDIQDKLQEAVDLIYEAIDECEFDLGQRDTMRAGWIAELQMIINNDHEWLGGHTYATIEEMIEQVESKEPEDTPPDPTNRHESPHDEPDGTDPSHIEIQKGLQVGDDWLQNTCAICGQIATLPYRDIYVCDDCHNRIAAYEDRRDSRAEYLAAKAARLHQEADSDYKRAHSMASLIPFGQPILVGHHSEKADRRYRGKIERTYRRSFNTYEEAKATDRRAEAARKNRAIFSDDPAAVIKLREKIEAATKEQEHMKAVNKTVRKVIKQSDDIQEQARLLADVHDDVSFETAVRLLTPDFLSRIGYEGYLLKNNNANIRRMKQRLEDLESRNSERASSDNAVTQTTFGDIVLERDLDANRLRLKFPDKPPKSTRDILKANGFRWSREAMAWQRHLNSGSEFAARTVLHKIGAIQPPTPYPKGARVHVNERGHQRYSSTPLGQPGTVYSSSIYNDGTVEYVVYLDDGTSDWFNHDQIDKE